MNDPNDRLIFDFTNSPKEELHITGLSYDLRMAKALQEEPPLKWYRKFFGIHGTLDQAKRRTINQGPR